MTDTGRLTTAPGARTRRVVYGEHDATEITAELDLITRVDLAHVVMLTEQALLDHLSAARLLSRITELRADGFRELHGLAMPRGSTSPTRSTWSPHSAPKSADGCTRAGPATT